MQESTELRAWLESMYHAMAKADLDWLKAAVSPGDATVAIGSDPAEWWEGGTVVQEKLAAQFEAGVGGARFEPTRLRAYEEGDVGWVSDEPRVVLPDGTATSIRVTAVLHREHGEWRMVQNHASVGVSNEQVIGTTLPT